MNTLWLSARRLFGLLLVFSVAGLANARAEIHVWGTDTYPADETNVQAALDAIEPGGTVVLHGTFNFGTVPGDPPHYPMGGVTVTTPGVTLVGNDALIHGGGRTHWDVWGNKVMISVEAVGVTVRNIVFDGTPLLSGIPQYNKVAVMVYVIGSSATDDPVVIERNEISNVHKGVLVRKAEFLTIVRQNEIDHTMVGVHGYFSPGPLWIGRNEITSAFGTPYGILVYPGGGGSIVGNTVTGYGVEGIAVWQNQGERVVITGNQLSPSPFGGATYNIDSWGNACPVSIIGNTICESAGAGRNAVELGISVGSNPAAMGLDQDNPPVLVTGNRIDMQIEDGPNDYSLGISVSGGPNMITSNALVTGNRITGSLAVGLDVGPHGKNNHLIGNNLSGLTTWEAQIALRGSQNCLVKGNVLGPANSGMHPDGLALLLTSDRMTKAMPMPYPTEKNTIMGNDYRLTGLSGWSDGLEGDDFGCIAIYSMADLLEDGEMGTEVRYNLVKETAKFPSGTGPGDQIFEWTESGLVHDNVIWGVSHPFPFGAGLLATLRQKVQRMNGVLSRIGNFEERVTEALGKLSADADVGPQPSEASPPSGSGSALQPTAPQSYKLVGNYPNPFNPSTVITYALPVGSKVTLAVYNLLGERVALLVDEHQSAGFHQAVFTDPGLASGVYIYRLTAGDFAATKKLMLLK